MDERTATVLRLRSTLKKLDAAAVQLREDGYPGSSERIAAVSRFVTEEIEALQQEAEE
jgi:hypothetical protein